MQLSPIESVAIATTPEHRPEENQNRPWAVDYRGGTRFDGTPSPAGTFYFHTDADAVAWRAAVMNPPQLPF